MASNRATPDVEAAPAADPAGYTVVARRYRPQRFEDVVGQDHVVRALRNAIRLDRVAQAYLFSGTRGVGKTSLARIFAKCLNCERGPTDDPDQTCDICRAIAVGQDIDVIEIDGASNNGVEAVRELRQNAGLRPSRARYKIYYIDEVHMLSTGAFNALLKTLEEPPGHVKFFFATTEANKIPITVLSRCQRFDLAGIAPEAIVSTLRSICRSEGVLADDEALGVLARRAAGSLRDAQSLLEQLLSSAGERLTVDLVHSLLGTASDDRMLDLLGVLADRDPAGALRLVEGAVNSGVQPADLLTGALEFLRDAMFLAAGADGPLLAAAPKQVPRLKGLVQGWSLDAIVAAMQILAETRARLRGSPHGRLLVELALVRVARLDDFNDLGEMISRLAALDGGRPGAPVEKKKREPIVEPRPAGLTAAPDPPTPTPTPTPDRPARGPIALEDALAAWPQLANSLGLKLGAMLSQVRPTSVAGADVLVVPFTSRYNYVAEACQVAEARERIEAGLLKFLGRSAKLRFEPTGAAEPDGVGPDGGGEAARPGRPDLDGDPMVRKVMELFEARAVKVELAPDDGPPND